MSSFEDTTTPPRSRRNDPMTSVEAGEAADLHRSQTEVLAAFTMGRERTQSELETLVPLYSPSRIRSAVSELESRGLVEKTGEQRVTRFGKKANVYRAVAA